MAKSSKNSDTKKKKVLCRKECFVTSRVEFFKGDIQEIIKSYRTIKRWAYILHDKDDTALHYHIYLHFGRSSQPFDRIAGWFGLQESQVETVKKTGSVLEYLAMIISTIAYYLYFIAALKTPTIYIQLCKLLMDASVVPTFLWYVIGFIAFLKLRRKIGYDKLEHMENKDRGFINERPIVLMLCGTMGKKKTTIITDMALSQEIMFRDKAFEKILDCDLKFPYFPWINLENEIKHCMDKHYIYNLATCERFVKFKFRKWRKKQRITNIFGYDYNRYGIYYNGGLMPENIWQIIENYTKLYFIYVIESSLRHLKKKKIKSYEDVHPKYVYERYGDDYSYLSITHTKPKEGEYVKLKHNVDSCDADECYISAKAKRRNYNDFGRRERDWRIHPDDKKIVNNIIKKNKKNGK